MNRNRQIIAAGTVASALLLVGGGWYLTQRNAGDPLAKCRETVVSGGMESFGGPFTLTDENGNRVTEKEVFARPALLYFGYTFCPDICPVDAARNAAAAQVLKSEGYDIRTVFITIDPQRDTPEILRDFTDAMDPEMLGLTGTDAEIATANKAWRNYYQRHPGDDPEYYLMDHATSSFLVIPKLGTVEYFNRDTSADDMAQRSACFLDAAARV